MSDDESTHLDQTVPDLPVSNATSDQAVIGSSGNSSAALPGRVGRLLSNRRRTWIVAAALICSVIGLSIGLVASSSATATPSTSTPGKSVPGSGSAGGVGSAGGSNARSGPASGGAPGTVSKKTTSGFTMTTSAGQKVTVDDTSSTTYQSGTRSASSSAVTTGEPVLVLGTTDGTTITAAQVIVHPTGTGSVSSSPAVVPFQRGAPTASKQVGQIPANWSQGSGTIISGAAADEATTAALAAYPGGVVDRVVKLSNGEYNVHYIGVNRPHHVFLNQDFVVIGAE